MFGSVSVCFELCPLPADAASDPSLGPVISGAAVDEAVSSAGLMLLMDVRVGFRLRGWNWVWVVTTNSRMSPNDRRFDL